MRQFIAYYKPYYNLINSFNNQLCFDGPEFKQNLKAVESY
jgi:hypothetical protein